jgi:DNA polymerase-3 subunit epsilon
MYSIVDIETTGNGFTGSKITEISIFIYDGEKVVDEYTTLVNPECNIPPFITNLTGITNAMVSNAPKFYEIAKKVAEITENNIFVAHSVNFDYNIIKKEFKDLGADFRRKKLCTIRLSRKLLPGLKSYSLGAICRSQNITITNRHRARGDAEATTILFEKLLQSDHKGVFRSFLNPRSRQATLPPMLSKKIVDNLSEKTGVYYFKDEHDKIIYVGKAKNIKQRVISHFYDTAKKEITMCMETSNVSFIETGNELVALLLESSEIKKIFPKYNRAQRRAQESVGLFSYEDRDGILHIAYNRLKLVSNPLMKFYNITECRVFLENLCENFDLCPKYCHLQTNVSSCFHYQIKKCKGICRHEEAIDLYNIRVQQAITSVRFKTENFMIKEKGRNNNEYACVLVLNGIYKGFGYINKRKKIKKPDDYLEMITMLKDNNDIKRILSAYLKNDPETVISLN